MKKSIYLSALAFMLAGSALTSCSDFLDADNKSTGNKTADEFLQQEPESQLVTAYSTLYSITTNVSINEEGTDLYIPVRGKTASEFDQYTLNAENSDVYTYWKKLYALVNGANGAIYYNSVKKTASVDAEARFLRCYGYYLLTQQFGSVPYVTDYIGEYNGSYPRTNLDSIYTGCINDLKGVYEAGTLKSVSSRSNAAAPTQEAVALLISKFYLAKGWDIETTQSSEENGDYTASSTASFTEAASWAEKAINEKSLSMTFADKWAPAKDNNAETFWAVQPNRAESLGAHSLQNDYGNYYGECTATGYKNVGSLHAQSEKSLGIFASGDERYEATFMTKILNKGTAWGTTGYYAAYNDSAWTKIGYRYFPYYVTDAEAESEFALNQANYSYSKDDGNNENVIAYILRGDNQGYCTKYIFNADGSIKQKRTNIKYSELNVEVGGGTCVKKFDDPSSLQVTSKDDYRVIPVLGLSDAYLTAAEAYLMAGDEAKCLEKINAVRARSNAETLGTTMAEALTAYATQYSYQPAGGSFKSIDLVLDERARELYAERTRWIDLRRTKQLVRYNKAYNPNLAGSVKTLRPIPANEISANSGIDSQNTGY